LCCHLANNVVPPKQTFLFDFEEFGKKNEKLKIQNSCGISRKFINIAFATSQKQDQRRRLHTSERQEILGAFGAQNLLPSQAGYECFDTL